jgi:hypothetical protein
VAAVGCLGAILYACGSDDTVPLMAPADGGDATTQADTGSSTDATVDNSVPEAAIGDTGPDASDAAQDTTSADASDAGADVDAGPCSPDRVFRTLSQVAAQDAGPSSEYNMKLSLDELSAYFASNRTGDDDIYFATRAARASPFGAATRVTELSLAGPQEYWASADDAGTLVVLERDARLYVSTRATAGDPWGAPTTPTPLDIVADAGPGYYVGQPHLMADGATLYFASNLKGTWDIYRSTLAAGTWSKPTTVDELNTSALEWAPAVTADGLTIYFGSDRSLIADAGPAALTIWVAHRTSTASPFGPAHKVVEVDLGHDEWPAWISPDNCRLYFTQFITLPAGVQAYRTFVAEQ